MIKFATLIVTNIHRLYTGKEIHHHMVVFHHAYIAMHHDIIIGIGTGSYDRFIDKDTRVIDARGHCMIPGIIDVSMQQPCLTKGNEARIFHEKILTYVRHGVTTFAIQQEKPRWFVDTYESDVVWNPTPFIQYPVIDMEHIVQQKRYQRCCISAGKQSCHPLLTAQFYRLQHDISAITLCKALCVYPAKYLGLKNVGTLQVGMQADMVLLNCLDLDTLFCEMRDDLIYQVIKKGVRIYPNVLI